MNIEELKKLGWKRTDIESNPKDFTLLDYMNSRKNIIDFIKKRK